MKDRRAVGHGTLQALTEECAHRSDEPGLAQTIIAIASDGEWIPAEDLKERVLDAVSSAQNMALDFAGIRYLQGAALQVILACHSECERLGKTLTLVNVSSDLRAWFDHCGASWLLNCMGSE